MADLARLAYPTPEIVQCPFPLYKDLRGSAPFVHQTERGEFLVVRPEDVAEVARNPHIFSNFIGPVTPGRAGMYDIDPAKADDRTVPTPWPTPFTDGEDHDRKRSLLQPLVRGSRLAGYEPFIRQLADRLIDTFIDRGACDFKAEYARPIPPLTTLHALGVPEQDHAEVFQLLEFGRGHGQGMRHADAQSITETQERAMGARGYFRDLILKRQADPQDDFISEVIARKMARDGVLDLEFLVTDIIVLYGASFGNSVDLFVQAMYHLIKYPEVMARAREKPAMLARVIEETLRIESPVQWVARRVLEDTELAGVAIPKESICLVMYGAVNRDESRFENPDSFNIDRPRLMQHLAFGLGDHRCLGEALARQEAKIGLERLLARVDNIRLAPGQDHIPNVEPSNHRALVGLRIEFDTRA